MDESWWEGLEKRLLMMGLPPTAANALRQDFSGFAYRYKARLFANNPKELADILWQSFKEVFTE